MENIKLASFAKHYEDAGYIRKSWTILPEWRISLTDFCEVNSLYKQVVQAKIIKKDYTDKKGLKKTFLKVEFLLNEGTLIEWDLPYNKEEEYDFEDGDLLNLKTVYFCTEVFLKEEHKYVMGELLDE